MVLTSARGQAELVGPLVPIPDHGPCPHNGHWAFAASDAGSGVACGRHSRRHTCSRARHLWHRRGEGPAYQALVVVLLGVIIYAFLNGRRERAGQIPQPADLPDDTPAAAVQPTAPA